MSAELIKRKSKDDTLINLSVRISDNLTRANVMIEDLLDASKIRAGQSLSPIFQNFNLTELLLKTIEDLTSIHGDRFILIGPDELMVWQDPNGIRRVIENLCTNAIKYGSPVEKIRIKLDYGNKRMMVCVHNEGNPLMNIDKTRLFEPFQRGPDHEIAGKKGWGIGLTIVKGITEAHHGEVFVETAENGTTFKILLPIDARTETDIDQTFLS
jgi:signal transduction histidine kinase